MANRRKPTMQPPKPMRRPPARTMRPLDPTTVTNTALDAGVRAIEMTTAVARGLAKGALAAARAMSESFAQAANETTRLTSDVIRGAGERGKRAAPRSTPQARRTSRKTQGRRRRAA